MQVTEQTPNILKVQIKGWLNRLLDILIVSIFPLFGVLCIIISSIVPEVTLRCNNTSTLAVDDLPPQIMCSLTSSSVWSEDSRLIENLQDAQLEFNIQDGGRADKSRRVILITDDQKIPLTKEYTYISGSSEDSQHVAKIRRFINDPGGSPLTIHQDHRWILVLVGFGFILSGFIIGSVKSLISCVFDKSAGRLYLDHQTFLGQSKIEGKNLDDITMIKIDETTNEKRKKILTAKISFKSGEFISLGSSKNTHDIVKTINHFLEISQPTNG